MSKIKHGHSLNGRISPTYYSWACMMRRTKNKNHEKWMYYGGRGISVCESWNNFANFLYDMGERPKNCFLDRINNESNYEPGNCRWVTRLDQAKNKRSSVWIYFMGERIWLYDLIKKHNLCNSTIRRRLSRGWSIEKSVLTPGSGWRTND